MHCSCVRPACSTALSRSVLQATRPFIDPITFKKIVFVDSSSAALMDQKFDMTKMEACLGGTGGWTFDLASYARQMQ